MDISLFLAQVFGLYFILAGVVILVRPGAATELIRLFADRRAVYLSGFVALIVGIPLVLVHNIWDGSWRVFVTGLVWLTLLKGITLLFVPRLVAGWADVLTTYPRLMRHLVWLLIIAGVCLLSVGSGWVM
jgi:hypothetical protein